MLEIKEVVKEGSPLFDIIANACPSNINEDTGVYMAYIETHCTLHQVTYTWTKNSEGYAIAANILEWSTTPDDVQWGDVTDVPRKHHCGCPMDHKGK